MIFTGKDTARALKDPREISDLLQDEHNFVWFDLAEPTAADLQLLQEEFSLHPTAIEDAALVHERPKIESYDDVLARRAARRDARRRERARAARDRGLRREELRRHDPRAPGVPARRDRAPLARAKSAVPHTSTGLLYVILDVVVDGYHPVASEYDERLVALENRVLGRERNHPQQVLREVLAFKRDLVALRHAVAPVRDILSPLLRGDLAPLDHALLAYFRDVYDHALRVTDQIDSIRDLLNSTLDIHLSSEAHRQGEVSKQLTIIATIFLPLTYITGFFGQNFGWMVNHIDKPEHFAYIGIGSQLIALAILLAYFKRKGWF